MELQTPVISDILNMYRIVVVDKKYVLVTLENGDTIRYLYNPHFDTRKATNER